MTEGHWIERRLDCDSLKVFNDIESEVRKTISIWNTNNSSEAPHYRTARAWDDKGFEGIRVYQNDLHRAYCSHVPTHDLFVAHRNIIDPHGTFIRWERVVVEVTWDSAHDKCTMTLHSKEITIETLTRWMLESMLSS
ncbi:MAG: hypothetical protein OXE02_11080 [Chloroflexi bacterium]|nr:hypothetical protein [Chloroflexota bacterium]